MEAAFISLIIPKNTLSEGVSPTDSLTCVILGMEAACAGPGGVCGMRGAPAQAVRRRERSVRGEGSAQKPALPNRGRSHVDPGGTWGWRPACFVGIITFVFIVVNYENLHSDHFSRVLFRGTESPHPAAGPAPPESRTFHLPSQVPVPVRGSPPPQPGDSIRALSHDLTALPASCPWNHRYLSPCAWLISRGTCPRGPSLVWPVSEAPPLQR